MPLHGWNHFESVLLFSPLFLTSIQSLVTSYLFAIHPTWYMAGVTGLEPATSAVTGQRSSQLSYTPDSNC